MDDSVESLKQRLANLKAEIAELGADPANEDERRALEAQAGNVNLRFYKLRSRGAVARKR